MKYTDDLEDWSKDWTKEEKNVWGDPMNMIAHRRRNTKSVDRFEKRVDRALAKAYFNPNVD